MEAPESLEAIQIRHRKEQRELVSRITQKKKSASKKTRKGVNDECERLEQELKQRHEQELKDRQPQNGGGFGLDEATTETWSRQDELDKEALGGQPDGSDERNGTDNVGGEQSNGLEKATGTLSMPSSQLDTSTQQPNGPKKKQSRAKTRIARRAAEQEALASQAAEEAANLPDLREQERTRMKEHFERLGLQEKEIRADGHCLYAAVADQMETAGLGLKPKIQPKIVKEDTKLPTYKTVRHIAADFIAQNPDDFIPFMEEPLEEYLGKIRETGEWGGHMELLALAKTYGVEINVLHGDGRVDKIEPGEEVPKEDKKEIWLGYYKHNFGLGEHYNSLRKAP